MGIGMGTITSSGNIKQFSVSQISNERVSNSAGEGGGRGGLKVNLAISLIMWTVRVSLAQYIN